MTPKRATTRNPRRPPAKPLRSSGSLPALICALVILTVAGTPAAAQSLLPGNEAEITSRVHAGGTVEIPAGEYSFPQGWYLTEDVSIVGAGADATVLRFHGRAPGGWAAVDWRGAGSFVMSGVTVQLVSAEPGANVISIKNGSAELTGLVARGAIAYFEDEILYAGQGIRVDGEARASILNSEIVANEAYGLAITDNARVHVENSRVADNGDGVAVWGAATGLIRGSAITNNHFDGVRLGGSVSVTLEANEITHNGGDGVLVWGTATPSLTGNTVVQNGGAGVVVVDSAAPVISNSRISDNGDAGVRYEDQAAGTAANNEISLNAWAGIVVSDSARPTVERNTVTNNRTSGIEVRDRAAGTYRGNNVVGNAFEGLSLGGSSRATAENNHISGNGFGGVSMNDSAAGWLNDNTIERNSGDGVWCMDKASTSVRNNTISGNAGTGFVMSDGARCRESGSTFSNNDGGDREVY